MSDLPDSDLTDADLTDADQAEIHAALTDGRTRWKYYVVCLHDHELEPTINGYGQYGWELAFCIPLPSNSYASDQYKLIMKQPYWLTQVQSNE